MGDVAATGVMPGPWHRDSGDVDLPSVMPGPVAQEPGRRRRYGRDARPVAQYPPEGDLRPSGIVGRPRRAAEFSTAQPLSTEVLRPMVSGAVLAQDA